MKIRHLTLASQKDLRTMVLFWPFAESIKSHWHANAYRTRRGYRHMPSMKHWPCCTGRAATRRGLSVYRLRRHGGRGAHHDTCSRRIVPGLQQVADAVG